jgi:hypothetical protein
MRVSHWTIVVGCALILALSLAPLVLRAVASTCATSTCAVCTNAPAATLRVVAVAADAVAATTVALGTSLSPAATPKATVDPNARKPFAYVSYAATDQYFCGALVNFEQLARFNVSADRVVVMTSEFVKSASPVLMARAKAMGVIIRSVAPVPNPGGMGYYHQVFVKFRVFELLEYKRLLYFDSDCIFLKVCLFFVSPFFVTNCVQPMDELFLLPPAPLYAPRAWWEQKFFTSMFMGRRCVVHLFFSIVLAGD